MRKSRFIDEQIVAMLRDADRTAVAETAKKHKVSEQTIYVWRGTAASARYMVPSLRRMSVPRSISGGMAYSVLSLGATFIAPAAGAAPVFITPCGFSS